jgi:WD40 repeat protein
MTAGFIAYAREDTPFVARLRDALASCGRDTAWDQDRATVPFSAPWRAEIREAIRGSEKFIFVISPDSLDSGPCADELETARELNKPLVPILRRPPGGTAEVPAVLGELTWIDFSDDDAFGDSLADLLTALDTDLAWTKSHTRLLIRSAEWSDARERSLLLRGRDLRDAEEWLQRASGHDEARPTSLQRDYLAASRRAADRAVQRWRGALAGGLVVAVTLAVIAFVQRGQADTARDQAQREARVALSRELAVDSEGLDGPDPVTAAQLAAAAWGISRTSQAREALLDMAEQPVRAVLSVSGDSSVESVAFTPDGRVLATADVGGQVKLWNARSHRRVGTAMTAARFPYDVAALAFSPGGEILATGTDTGWVRLWDVASRQPIGAVLPAGTLPTNGVLAIAFSPDGRLLAAVSGDGQARVWAVSSSPRLDATLFLSPATFGADGAVDFSADGRELRTAYGGIAQTWNVASWRPASAPLVVAVTHPAPVLVFEPGSGILAVETGDKEVSWWSLATRRQIGSPMNIDNANGPAQLAFTTDAKILATASMDGTVRLWDVQTREQTGSPIVTSTGCGGVFAAAFRPQSTTLATGGCDGTARLWDVALNHQAGVVGSGDIITNGEPDVSQAFARGGKALITAGASARLWAVYQPRLIGSFGSAKLLRAYLAYFKDLEFKSFKDFESKRHRSPVNDPYVAEAAAASPVGDILATANTAGTIRLWNLATRQQIGTAVPGPGPPIPVPAGLYVIFSPDGRLLAAAVNRPFFTAGGPPRERGSVVRIWTVDTSPRSGPPLALQSQIDETASLLAFSPDGKILAMVLVNGHVMFWDVAAAHAIDVRGMASLRNVSLLAFSPASKLMATATGNTVRLWNLATHRQVGVPMTGGSQPLSSMSFSHDGQMLATGTEDGQIQLWDVATYRQIGVALPTPAPGAVADSIQFSPDDALVAASSFGATWLWNVAIPGPLLPTVCAIAGGPLNRQEWKSEVPALPYQRTCP